MQLTFRDALKRLFSSEKFQVLKLQRKHSAWFNFIFQNQNLSFTFYAYEEYFCGAGINPNSYKLENV